VAKWQLCGGKVLPAPASEAVPDSFHAPVTQLSRAEIIFYYEAWGFELCGIGGGWGGIDSHLGKRFGNGQPIVAAGRLNALLTERISLYPK
jgi:hypothetical protein